MMTTDNQTDQHGGYEKKDVNIVKVGGYTILTAVVILIIIAFLYDYFVSVREEMVFDTVLSKPSSELRELHAREAETLGSYGIVDSTKNQYRIPIDRAIDLVAEEAFQDSISKVKEASK